MREDAPPTVDRLMNGKGRYIKNSKIIALDCDGVLLDYGLTYADAWSCALAGLTLEVGIVDGQFVTALKA